MDKANLCLQPLAQNGLDKVGNARHRDDKLGRRFFLIQRVLDPKDKLAMSFLKHEITKYNTIRDEALECNRDVELHHNLATDADRGPFQRGGTLRLLTALYRNSRS